ncbi:hypothetical protein AB0N64_11020 [Microbacterium sp. NPDC089318]
MNYREHLSVPSAVRIVVSVAGRPEWDRTIELPTHSPETWLWEPYLLSIGVEAHVDVEALRYGHPHIYSNERWVARDAWSAPFAAGPVRYADDDFFGDDPTALAESAVRVPWFPYDLDITVGRAPDRQVGDASVSIVGAGVDSSVRPSKDWQTSAQPLDMEQANRELVRRFGVVLPFVRSESLRTTFDDISAGSLIADLLAPLTPVRRLALRVHLNAAGLLDANQLDIDAVRQATHALRALIDAVGPDGTDQDSTTGWLPTGVVDKVVAGVEWDAETAAALLSSLARRAGLIRRLRGRVVVNALGKQLMTDPPKAFPRIIKAITAGAGRYSYAYSFDTSRFGRAAALLALADGSAASYDELAGYLEKAHAARDTRSYDEYGDWYDSARSRTGFDPGEADRVLRELTDDLLALSAPGAFGLVTPHIRSVARAALQGR